MMTRTDASELFAAIKAGDEVAVRRLVEADPGLVNEREDGVTPLLTAYYYRQSDVAEWLRRARAPRDVFEAAAAGDAERVREFVARDQSLANAYAEDGFHPLGLAAFFKRPEAVRFLLAAGADPSAPARNPMKVTALHSAVANGGAPWRSSAVTKRSRRFSSNEARRANRVALPRYLAKRNDSTMLRTSSSVALGGTSLASG